jgi:predicted DCC family thiol-disulfide oxidoreductase YuxK
MSMSPATPWLVFYDGECGLCQRFVRRTVERDRVALFRFAPLKGDTFRTRVGGEPPSGTVVVLAPDGRRFVRSDAVVEILKGLGGKDARRAVWLARVPRVLRDVGYRAVAAVRRFLAPRPDGPCPLLPPELRGRFLP